MLHILHRRATRFFLKMLHILHNLHHADFTDTLPYTSTARVPMSMLHCPSLRRHRECEYRVEGSVCSSWYVYSAHGEISEEFLRDSFLGNECVGVHETSRTVTEIKRTSHQVRSTLSKVMALLWHAKLWKGDTPRLRSERDRASSRTPFRASMASLLAWGAFSRVAQTGAMRFD